MPYQEQNLKPQTRAVISLEPEETRASGGQIALTLLASAFILAFVFYGIANQRDENTATTGQQAAAPSNAGAQAQNNQPQGNQQQQGSQANGNQQQNAQAPRRETTGQGGGNNGKSNGKTDQNAPDKSTPKHAPQKSDAR